MQFYPLKSLKQMIMHGSNFCDGTLQPAKSLLPRSDTTGKTGNVAVVNKILVLKDDCRLCKISNIGCKNSTGNICASSRITTELQILCNFRHREVRQAYSDSKNCTFVVTIIGASQFSVANREGDRSSLLSG